MYFNVQGRAHAINTNAMHASYLFSIKLSICAFKQDLYYCTLSDEADGMPSTHRDGMFASKEDG